MVVQRIYLVPTEATPHGWQDKRFIQCFWGGRWGAQGDLPVVCLYVFDDPDQHRLEFKLDVPNRDPVWITVRVFRSSLPPIHCQAGVRPTSPDDSQLFHPSAELHDTAGQTLRLSEYQVRHTVMVCERERYCLARIYQRCGRWDSTFEELRLSGEVTFKGVRFRRKDDSYEEGLERDDERDPPVYDLGAAFSESEEEPDGFDGGVVRQHTRSIA